MNRAEDEPGAERGNRRVRVELAADEPCLIKRGFDGCLELELGLSGATPRCYLVPGDVCPQLGADYIVVQPEIVYADATLGWLPVGGRHPDHVWVGRTESPALVLEQSVDGEALLIWSSEETLELTRVGRSAVSLLVHESDLN